MNSNSRLDVETIYSNPWFVMQKTFIFINTYMYIFINKILNCMNAINDKLCVGKVNENGMIQGIHHKRFYTRGTLRSIRISRLAKIPTLYRN